MRLRTTARIVVLIGLSVMVALPGQAMAQDRELTETEVVSLAMERNPTLAAAMLAARKALEAVRAEEDLYPFMFGVDTGVARTTSPSLSLAPGGTALTSGESFHLTTGFSKSFSTGTSLSLDLTGTIDRREMTASAAGTAGGTVGPGYGLSGRLTLTQPLLRGFGTRIGEASLRQARLVRTVGEHQADRVASEVLRDVLGAWWELWYATRAQGIHEEARELAARKLAEVEARIDKGTLAPVEALAFRTTLAAREEDVAQATDLRRRQALELLRLMGMPEPDADGIRAVADAGRQSRAMPDAMDVIQEARIASFRVRELSARVDLARDQARVAGESMRPRLDLQAWVQGEGLGNRSITPAFEQIGRAEAGGAFVGLTFEMPLTDRRRQAQRQEAVLAVQIAEQELLAVLQQVATEAASWVSRRESADRRLELALRTQELAEQQTAAEQRRFEIGTAIALQVQQAEDALRQARLRVVRARVDGVQADLGIDHLTGRLLEMR
jgi:outer membrane protein TolC